MAKRTVEEEQDDNNKKKDKNDKLADQRLLQIRKALGITDESVRLADQHIAIKDVISTGLPELDKIMTPMIYEKTGKGGFPRGFVGEFYGPYSGGKSSLCMKLAGDVTKRGGFVLWIDAEGSYVSEWAAQHGVNNKNVVLIDNLGRTGEYFLEQVETIAASGTVELIVVDSVTALVPKEVLECALEKEARIGAGAKLMTRALPRIIAAAKKGDTAVIFVNQIRQKIGVVYGNPETTPMGEALKFYSSLRLRLSQVGRSERNITKGEEDIGIRTNVRIEKSRFGPPFKECIMPIYYGNALPQPLDSLLDAALASKVLKSRSKSMPNGERVQTFTFGSIKKDGMDEFKKALDNTIIKKMAELITVETKTLLEAHVQEYINKLGADELTSDAPPVAETDPGA